MKIETLVFDIYEQLKKKDWVTDELRNDFEHSIGKRIQTQFKERMGASSLRLSKMGPTCPKALWYSVHHPELAELMPPWAINKFSVGHMIEAWALTLSKASGHSVKGEQDELIVDGIIGHRDCVLDGHIVDIKSCSSRMFKRFEDRSIKENDGFGYLDQLDGYTVASVDDPLVSNVNKAYILAVDKQLGHMCLYPHEVRHEHIRNRISSHKKSVGSNTPPTCECGLRTLGNSGNIALDIKASYSAYKHCCFPRLRTFLYSDGPVYLTKVVRVPEVPEINKEGRVISKLH